MSKVMDSFAASNFLTPTIAILSSEGAEAVALRNNLSFTDLLSPFCTAHQTIVNDPSGQQSSLKLQIGLRDIKRNGYLLSLTVLPSVLHQTVHLCSQNNANEDAWSAGFKEYFHYWQEPSSHDFLKSYICCMFVVSASDSDPIATLSNLIHQQNQQQHGSADSANTLSPAHCAVPKWFLPQILKYYVLVQDNLKDDEEKTKTIFSTMSSTYGQQFCYHLKINSTESSNMPDPWSKSLTNRYRGLENGLEIARRELLNKSNSTPHTLANDLATLNVSSIATVSSDVNGLHLNLDTNSPPKRSAVSASPNLLTNIRRGNCLDTDDRDRIRSFIEYFIKNALVPFVERQLVTQNDALINRRGIGKSFTNMKKWLNVGSSSAPQLSSNSTHINYANESPEMQTRRLADLAFLFGLYSYSNQLYQSLKKDFLNDQAWLHHAGALEMAALSSFLSSTPAQLKNYPARYMENAVEFYANTCSQQLLAIRCVLYSAEILTYLEKYTEAANQIVRITSTLPDIYGSVLLERASTLFGRGKMFRRQAFHSVLAGHRYEKSDLMQLASQCYKKALPEYMDKQWTNAEDNVLCVVSRDSTLKLDDRIECSQRLVRPYCLNQSEDQQQIFLKNYLRQTTDENRLLSVPIVKNIETFFGINPSSLNDEDLKKQGFSLTPDCLDMIADPNWTDIERAAFLSIHGASSIFRQSHNFANDSTKNTHIYSMPANEPYSVRMELLNPLKLDLELKNLRLQFGEINCIDGQPFSRVSQIDDLVLPGVSMVETSGIAAPDRLYTVETQSTQVSLFCIPTITCKEFTVNALKFDICIGEESFSAHVPISTHGRRLFGNKAELSTKIYAADNRLKARVSSQPHPSLNFQITNNQLMDQSLEIQTTQLNLFCSQIHQLNLKITNNGTCDVKALSVAYDRPDLLTFYDSKIDSQLTINTNVSCPGVFTTSLIDQESIIKPGDIINLKLIVHAPSEPIKEVSERLVFLYTSTGNINRVFRHKLEISTTALVESEIKVLDAEDKLCVLEVRNTINSRDTILVQIECLRLEARLKSSNGYFVDLHPLSNRKVILDTDQSDLYCFYIRFTKTSPHGIIMNDDKSKLYWPYLSKIQTDHLQFALTWRAKITRETTSSIHGQSIISNPFIEFPKEELNLLLETATPNMLIQTRLLRQLVKVPADENEHLLFSLTPEECKQLANINYSEDLPNEIKIPWSIDL